MSTIKVTNGKSEDGLLCFDQQGKPVSEYQGEAKLVWQAHDPGSDWVIVPSYDSGYYNIRRVYITSPQAEREPVGVDYQKDIILGADQISYDTFENGTKFILIGNQEEPRIWYCSNENLIQLRDFLNQLPL